MPGPKVGGEMGEVSVMLVYDIASEIGKECEKLIDKFGSDAVATLIPQVINALELLEALANRNESENSTVQELNDRITQLETEKLEKAEYRKRFEKVRHPSGLPWDCGNWGIDTIRHGSSGLAIKMPKWGHRDIGLEFKTFLSLGFSHLPVAFHPHSIVQNPFPVAQSSLHPTLMDEMMS